MNKDIYKKAKSLNQWIREQDVVKEYQRYENLLHEHSELSLLEDELKQLQKKIVNDKHQGIDCSKLILEYEKKKKIFDENPIVYNYLALKSEVNQLIKDVQDDINEQLKKMID